MIGKLTGSVVLQVSARARVFLPVFGRASRVFAVKVCFLREYDRMKEKTHAITMKLVRKASDEN